MKVFQGRNLNHLYIPTLRYILQDGKSVNPRGLKTKEVYPAVTIIEKPRERFLSCYGRNINPFFLVAEALWILASKGDVKWISYYNSQLNKYNDGYHNFHGAYGMRVRRYGVYKDNTHITWRATTEVDQLREVINKLKKDKYTRQAVVCLWNPFFDNQKSKDIPCNNLSMFKIRNNKLHLHQILRSNDVNLGLYPTNVFQFSMIQEYVASALGIEVGHLLFFSDSLHCYIDLETKRLVNKILNPKNNPLNKELGTIRTLRYNVVTFDIYKYMQPLYLMGVDTLENLDKVLHSVTINEDRYRRGIFDVELASDNPFWISVELMLKVYNLRKYKSLYESIEETSYIPSKDFRVLAYQYAHNKAIRNKDTSVQKWIDNFLDKETWNKKINDFIRNGGN